MDNLLVFLYAGGSAAGKTTTTKAFVEGEPEEHCEVMNVPTRKGYEDKKVFWTIYDNCGLAGTHRAGSDSNNGPGCHRAAFTECVAVTDVVLVDGKINSPQWVEMVNEIAGEYNVEIVCLYYNLSPETLLHRLAGRRGVEVESIRDSMFEKCEIATGRADLMVKNVHKLAEVPYTVVEIDDDTTIEEIVDEMDAIVAEFFECGCLDVCEV